jgi:hypothetical protein
VLSHSLSPAGLHSLIVSCSCKIAQQLQHCHRLISGEFSSAALHVAVLASHRCCKFLGSKCQPAGELLSKADHLM